MPASDSEVKTWTLISIFIYENLQWTHKYLRVIKRVITFKDKNKQVVVEDIIYLRFKYNTNSWITID